MPNPILLKRSSVAGSSPSTLSHGELALNYSDGKLYYKNAANQIVEFAGGAPSAATAWAYFQGTVNVNLSGTYSQSGTTVTVSVADHGLRVGEMLYHDYTSGTAVDSSAQVVSVIDANTYTVYRATSATTSGNVTLRFCNIIASSGVRSVADLGTGLYAVNFTSALPSNQYAAVANTSANVFAMPSTNDDYVYLTCQNSSGTATDVTVHVVVFQ